MNTAISKLNSEIKGLLKMRDDVGNNYSPIPNHEAFHLLFDKRETLSSFEYVAGKYVLTHYRVSERHAKMAEILGTKPEPYLTELEDGSEEGFRASNLSVTDILKKEFIINSSVTGLMSPEDREKLTEAQEEEPRLEHGKDYIMLRNGLRAYVGDKIFVHPADIPVAIESDDVSVNGQYAEVKEIKGNYFIVSLKMYFKASKVHGSMLLPISYVRIDEIQNTQERNTRW